MAFTISRRLTTLCAHVSLAAAANPHGGTTLLPLADAGLLRSEKGSATRQDLSGLLEGDAGAMCLAAPGVLDAGAAIFVGRVDGTVQRIVLPVFMAP